MNLFSKYSFSYIWRSNILFKTPEKFDNVGVLYLAKYFNLSVFVFWVDRSYLYCDFNLFFIPICLGKIKRLRDRPCRMCLFPAKSASQTLIQTSFTWIVGRAALERDQMYCLIYNQHIYSISIIIILNRGLVDFEEETD